jgi:hypothetical protein
VILQTKDEGHSINTCTCVPGPHLITRKVGTPDCCGICGFMTQQQFDNIAEAILSSRQFDPDRDVRETRAIVESILRGQRGQAWVDEALARARR